MLGYLATTSVLCWLTFGEKIARFIISQFYMIEINHLLPIDIAEFPPKELFFLI